MPRRSIAAFIRASATAAVGEQDEPLEPRPPGGEMRVGDPPGREAPRASPRCPSASRPRRRSVRPPRAAAPSGGSSHSRRRAPAPGSAPGRRRRTVSAIGAPSLAPSSAARPLPAASITARTSSIRVSRSGRCAGSTRSESPVPRLSKWISRAKPDSRRSSRAVARVLPVQLEVRQEPRHEHQVERALPDHLVGDPVVAAPRVACLRQPHDPHLRRSARPQPNTAAGQPSGARPCDSGSPAARRAVVIRSMSGARNRSVRA